MEDNNIKRTHAYTRFPSECSLLKITRIARRLQFRVLCMNIYALICIVTAFHKHAPAIYRGINGIFTTSL